MQSHARCEVIGGDISETGWCRQQVRRKRWAEITDGSKHWCSYMLHVSRKTLNCRGDSALYFSQKVFFRFRTSHILLGQEMNKTPARKQADRITDVSFIILLILCKYSYRFIHFLFIYLFLTFRSGFNFTAKARHTNSGCKTVCHSYVVRQEINLL